MEMEVQSNQNANYKTPNNLKDGRESTINYNSDSNVSMDSIHIDMESCDYRDEQEPSFNLSAKKERTQ